MFPKWTNRAVKLVLLGAVAVILGVGAIGGYVARPEFTDVGYTPEQPVSYSHKLHVGTLGIDCRFCHTGAEQGASAAIPPTQTCMTCHSKVKTDSPQLLRVRESFAADRPMEWVRVHKLPDFVFFNHKAHVSAGVSCASCHGRVDQMEEVKQVAPLNMSWCLDCHRDPAPHIRPPDLVTKLDWVPPRDPAEIGRDLITAKNINPPVNCSGCHR